MSESASPTAAAVAAATRQRRLSASAMESLRKIDALRTNSQDAAAFVSAMQSQGSVPASPSTSPARQSPTRRAVDERHEGQAQQRKPAGGSKHPETLDNAVVASGMSTPSQNGGATQSKPAQARGRTGRRVTPSRRAVARRDSDSTGTEGSLVEFESGDEQPGNRAATARRHSLPTSSTLQASVQRAPARDGAQHERAAEGDISQSKSPSPLHSLPVTTARGGRARRASVDLGAVARTESPAAPRGRQARSKKPAVPKQRKVEAPLEAAPAPTPTSPQPGPEQPLRSVSSGTAALSSATSFAVGQRAKAAIAPLMQLVETIRKHAWEMDAMGQATRMRAAAMSAATLERHSARRMDVPAGPSPTRELDAAWQPNAARSSSQLVPPPSAESLSAPGAAAIVAHADLRAHAEREPPVGEDAPQRWVSLDVRSQPVLPEHATGASDDHAGRDAADAPLEETDFVVTVRRVLAAQMLHHVEQKRLHATRLRAFYRWRQFAAVESAVVQTLALLQEARAPSTEATTAPESQLNGGALPHAAFSSASKSSSAARADTVASSTRLTVKPSRRDVLAARAMKRYRVVAGVNDHEDAPVPRGSFHMRRQPSGRLEPTVEEVTVDDAHRFAHTDAQGEGAASAGAADTDARVVRVEHARRANGAPASSQAWADGEAVDVVTIEGAAAAPQLDDAASRARPSRGPQPDSAERLQRLRDERNPASPMRVKNLDSLGRPVATSYAHADYWRHVMHADAQVRRAPRPSSSSTRKRNRASELSDHESETVRVRQALTTDPIAPRISSIFATAKARVPSLRMRRLDGTDGLDGGVQPVVRPSPSRTDAAQPTFEDTVVARQRSLGLPASALQALGIAKEVPLLHQLSSPLRSQQQALASMYRHARTSEPAKWAQQVVSVVQPTPLSGTAEPSGEHGRHIFVVAQPSAAAATSRLSRTQSRGASGFTLASPTTKSVVSMAAGARSGSPSSPLLGSHVSQKVVVTEERRVGSVVVRDVVHAADVTNAFGWHLRDVRHGPAPDQARATRVIDSDAFIASPRPGAAVSVGQVDGYVRLDDSAPMPIIASPRPLRMHSFRRL